MNKSAIKLGWLVMVLLVTVTHGAPVFPLPPFTVYGKVRDWNGRALVTADEAVVIARTTNGAEVARSPVTSGIYPDLTYRLTIPLASGPAAGRGQVGEPLLFEVYYDGLTHAVTTEQAVPIGHPATALGCTLMLGTFSHGSQLPDEYLELLLGYYQMAGWGNDLSDISPDDDFDGDGYSNFQEFLAGTIPVLPEDYLRVLGFSMPDTTSSALRFMTAPGRTYAIPFASQIGSNAWGRADFVTSTNGVAAQNFYSSEHDAYITIYLIPTTNAAYYGVEVK